MNKNRDARYSTQEAQQALSPESQRRGAKNAERLS